MFHSFYHRSRRLLPVILKLVFRAAATAAVVSAALVLWVIAMNIFSSVLLTLINDITTQYGTGAAAASIVFAVVFVIYMILDAKELFKDYHQRNKSKE